MVAMTSQLEDVSVERLRKLVVVFLCDGRGVGGRCVVMFAA
jgi:hypothetical protein